MIIRTYRSSDCEPITRLFYDTVHSVNANDYTEEQLNAWATGHVDFAAWDRSLSAHYSLVALAPESESPLLSLSSRAKEIVVGFGDIDETGYLDRLYVHKDFQNRGIASALCDRLEQAFP